MPSPCCAPEGEPEDRRQEAGPRVLTAPRSTRGMVLLTTTGVMRLVSISRLACAASVLPDASSDPRTITSTEALREASSACCACCACCGDAERRRLKCRMDSSRDSTPPLAARSPSASAASAAAL